MCCFFIVVNQSAPAGGKNKNNKCIMGINRILIQIEGLKSGHKDYKEVGVCIMFQLILSPALLH